MEENPVPIYVIEFMTDEWKIWTLFSIIFISAPLILAKFLNRSQKIMVTYLIGAIMILDFITENGGYIINGTWDIQYNLPIQLCGISSLICCILPFLKKKDSLFQFVYYTGVIGGIMAILTPQMNYFDGSLRYYLNYYVSHSLIITLPIFMFLHLDLKLPKFSWFKIWIHLNILMAIIMPINFILESNYMYVNDAPEVNNPLVIGEWPYYLFIWEPIVLIIAYLIYSISKRKIIF
ncbi:MAG: TIGR02206 family membrane protein [Flavobacteriaceae bacterium]|nr:TIGR02206 family membrane protein [Flavobacteriaceae bacterium]